MDAVRLDPRRQCPGGACNGDLPVIFLAGLRESADFFSVSELCGTRMIPNCYRRKKNSHERPWLVARWWTNAWSPPAPKPRQVCTILGEWNCLELLISYETPILPVSPASIRTIVSSRAPNRRAAPERGTRAQHRRAQQIKAVPCGRRTAQHHSGRARGTSRSARRGCVRQRNPRPRPPPPIPSASRLMRPLGAARRRAARGGGGEEVRCHTVSASKAQWK